MTLLFLVILHLISIESALSKPIINIVVSPPRGGFGDTAANLLMAERLTYLYEKDFDVRLTVPEVSRDQVKQLWPEFDSWRIEQKLGDLKIKVYLNKIENADYMVTFSANGSGVFGTSPANTIGACPSIS
jgi:hypothetical protein